MYDIELINSIVLNEDCAADKHRRNINGAPGVHHYKLLAYLSTIIEGYIVELGTHFGTSALALSYGGKTVHTYDVIDKWQSKCQPENIVRHIGNIFDENPEIMLDAAFIFIDTAHRGDFELKVHQYLMDNNYQGFAIYDDIHYNDAMRYFWQSIDIEKHDITDIGHGYSPDADTSGTGLIYYR